MSPRAAFAAALLVVGPVLATGCITDSRSTAHLRPARLELGMASRHLAVMAPPPSDVPPGPYGASAKTTGGTGTTMDPTSEKIDANATVGTARFTMATRYHTYAGAEVEAGTLGHPGSNIAGVFGVFGAEAAGNLGRLAVEVAGGWRTMSYSPDESDQNSMLVEPRVRGEFWISDQLSLGATLGATLDHERDHGWMAGAYLGVHSNLFDSWSSPAAGW